MYEVLKEIVVPIITTVFGFLGGMKYQSKKSKKSTKSISAKGSDILITGSNND